MCCNGPMEGLKSLLKQQVSSKGMQTDVHDGWEHFLFFCKRSVV